jgi:hypothetical protein
MGIKDCVYLGLIAVFAIGFYLYGLYTVPRPPRRKRKLDVPFNDSECLTELPDEGVAKPLHERIARVPLLTQEEIRQAFGNN